LLWRPLGYVIGHALGTLDTYSSTLWTLQGLCLAASVVGVVAIYVLCRNVTGPGMALFVAAFSAVSNGYWVYAFSGCSYTLGVLFQTLALHYAIREREAGHRWRNALAAGAFGGLALSAWGPNALAAPAILFALITATAGSCKRVQQSFQKAAAFALGYATTSVLPFVLAFVLARNLPSWRVGMQTSSGLTFAKWLSTANNNGVPLHVGATQLLRAAMGWAQSVVSLSDVGYRLRLWHFGEGPFPVSLWSLVLLLFYVGVLVLAVILIRSGARLDTRLRSLTYASVFALGLNLAFGAAWQGADLERYLPSLPFQMLLLAITLNLLWERVDRVPFLSVVLVTAIAALVIVNWQGTFKPVLDADSYRNLWVTAIRQHASQGDVVVVLGQRKSVIVPPHDGNFPRIDMLSDEIEQGGARWRSEIDEIRLTQRRGGRVFLADSLFWLDSAPRDGWSFKEHPMPTPREIHDAFMPFKSETVAFTVGEERVWAARTDTAP